MDQLRLSAAVLVLATNACANHAALRDERATPATSSTVDTSEQGQTNVQLTRSSASRMTTAQLVRLLLPDQPAERFQSPELDKTPLPGGQLLGIDFFARPSPTGADLCRREVVRAQLEPVADSPPDTIPKDAPVKLARTSNGVQIAAAPECRMMSGGFFAWVQPARLLPDAQQSLRRLLSLQAAAKGNAPFVSEIACKTETPEDVCDRPSREVLASLPLHQIFIIDRYTGGWEFSVMPNGPGPGMFWNVRLADDRDAVELSWRIVPPL